MAITKERATKDGILGGCPLIGNREKIDFDDLVNDVITVEDFMETKTKDGTAYAITFEELPESYAWCGGFLKACIEKYGEEFKGTKLQVGLKEKTNNGRTFRTFEIID